MRGAVIYIGMGKDLAVRCRSEAAWRGEPYLHAHALAARRTAARLWAGPVRRGPAADRALEQWLQPTFVRAMTRLIAATPAERAAETLALRVSAWLAGPAPANAVHNDPRATGPYDTLAWALAQHARRWVHPAQHPAHLLHPGGLGAALAVLGLSVTWTAPAAGGPGLLAHVDGTARRPRQRQPLLRVSAATNPQATAAGIAAEDTALARYLRTRSALTLGATVRLVHTSRLRDVLKLMRPLRRLRPPVVGRHRPGHRRCRARRADRRPRRLPQPAGHAYLGLGR